MLGVFVNDGYDETVTVAQVFHQKDRTGQPDRFFVTSTRELSVEIDFAGFGADLNTLRRRLRAGGAEITNGFPDYGRTVRRLLGIRSEQAMELFHQTVSMKSVGNLNEFVRGHMLEPADATTKVKGIVAHFEDLTKAHDAVKRAREQLEALRPLVATSEKYDDALVRRADAEAQREAVRLFFAELRIRLLTDTIAINTDLRTHRAGEADEAAAERHRLATEREQLITERTGAGGDRVSQLEQLASSARTEADVRRGRRDRFTARLADAGLADGGLADAGLTEVADASSFSALLAATPVARQAASDEQAELDGQVSELTVRQGELRRTSEETRTELLSLAGRTSNLPSSQLEIREQLCADLGIDEGELPFAGELIDVADDFSEWRGAAERVLRGFALSLIVPQHHYDGVARWVNDRRLTHRRNDGRVVGSRLVYERMPARRVRVNSPAVSGVLLLADTLEVREGPFLDYLEGELVRRADYRCVDDLVQFRDERRAVTRQGQVRSGDRHEKDDRSRVDDPRAWVLGWVNERKVAALTEQLVEQQRQTLDLDEQLAHARAQRTAAQGRVTALASLAEYTSWAELDWASALAEAEQHEAERARLVSGSSALTEIERRLDTNAEQSSALDHRLERLHGTIAQLDDRIARDEAARTAEQHFVAETAVNTPDGLDTARAAYPLLEKRLGAQRPTTTEACRPASDRLTDELDAGIRRINTEIGGYTQSLLQYMAEARRRWPEATTEMDASVDSRADFTAFHDRVAGDDLPRFEEEFKRQLNTNTIRELAQFNNWLRRQAEDIDVRVARINEALGAIDYSPGRYIRLLPERTVNQEIQTFRTELRGATDNTLSPDDEQYSEQRFLDVQRIIERFRGRDGYADSDKAWTRRVTDVRNWFTFSASERDRETDAEWEHYRDSDGKSGGQKEKLAYTILAASLAYQFGLEWGAERSRDFRFAVIDEAFGRGSDTSTRYALELFAKLGLQLLIVTPLQKVHVIEPYVQAIGFVDNPTGRYSRLQTLTIEEFRGRRSGRLL